MARLFQELDQCVQFLPHDPFLDAGQTHLVISKSLNDG